MPLRSIQRPRMRTVGLLCLSITISATALAGVRSDDDANRFVPAAATTTPQLSSRPAKAPAQFAEDRVIVKFKSVAREPTSATGRAQRGSPEQQGQLLQSRLGNSERKALAAIQGNVIRGFTRSGALVIHTGLKVNDAIESLYRSGRVDYAQADFRYEQSAKIPNDPLFAEQWALNNTGQAFYYGSYSGTADADIDAPEAWGTATDASATIIGVVDTGVAYNHPDLADNMWTNPGEIAGNGIDDDGNGYIDDVYGLNAIPSYGTVDPYDDAGHGTHVSGIAAARGKNGLGVAGVAWRGKIMALKFLDSGGSGYTSDAITAIDYALNVKAAQGYPRMVLNNSWGGGGFDQALYDIIDSAGDDGVLFMAAAGNSSLNTDTNSVYPAAYDLPNVISVGASNYYDQQAYFSNYGCSSVDLFAPGEMILSTVPYDSYNGQYDFYSGTSMATPMVTGAAALVWATYPSATWQKIKNALYNSVDPVAGMAGLSVTQGRLNLQKALKSNLQTQPTVWAITPAIATPGSQITITGASFGSSPGTVKFGSTTLTVNSWKVSTIVATVPAGTPYGSGTLTVKNSSGTAGAAGGCMKLAIYEQYVKATVLPHAWNASAQVGNNLWMIGGGGYTGMTGMVERYTMSSGRSVVDTDWSMPTPATNITGAAIDSKIYVPGGLDWNTGAVFDTLQILDTSAGTWSYGTPMPVSRSGIIAAASGGKLYAFGGNDGSTVSPNAYVYNPAANSWSSIASMLVGVDKGVAVTQSNGRIRIYGGFMTPYLGSEAATVQEYNPSNNTWKQLGDMPMPRAGMGLTKSGDYTYALHGTGGSDGFYGRSDGDLYSASANAWYAGAVTGSGPWYTPSAGANGSYVYLLNGIDYYYGNYSLNVYRLPAP